MKSVISKFFIFGLVIFLMDLRAVGAEELPLAAQGQVVAAQDSDLEKATYMICKHNKSVRTLRLRELSDGRCQSVYTKDGVDQIAAGSKSLDTCVRVIHDIRVNLEAHQWTCRDVSKSQVSEVSEEKK